MGNTIGERIKVKREEIGLSIEELASLLEVKLEIVKKYEAGDAIPTTDTINKIATILGTTQSYLTEYHQSYETELDIFYNNKSTNKYIDYSTLYTENIIENRINTQDRKGNPYKNQELEFLNNISLNDEIQDKSAQIRLIEHPFEERIEFKAPFQDEKWRMKNLQKFTKKGKGLER